MREEGGGGDGGRGWAWARPHLPARLNPPPSPPRPRRLSPLYLRLVESDPEVSVTTLRPGDTLLIMASDGLWDVRGRLWMAGVGAECGGVPGRQPNQPFSPWHPYTILKQPQPILVQVIDDQLACDIAGTAVANTAGPAAAAAEAAARALVDAALARQTMDNVTAVCGILSWGG